MRRAYGARLRVRVANALSCLPLRAQDGAARAGEEAGLDEQRHRLRLRDGDTVERSTARRFAPPALDVGDESRERRPSHTGSGSRSGTSERPPRSTKSAASPSSSTTHAPATRAARAPERRGQGSAAPYGCAGSAAASTSASGSSPRATGAELTEALDGTRERELRTAEPLDEVAAPADAERLERLQLRVDGAVPAADPLAANAVARDDPLALEEELCERPAIGGLGEQRRRERPPALCR